MIDPVGSVFAQSGASYRDTAVAESLGLIIVIVGECTKYRSLVLVPNAFSKARSGSVECGVIVYLLTYLL